MLIAEIIEGLKLKQSNYDKTKDVNELQDCIRGYNELLNQEPEDPEIIFQLATGHLQLGFFGTALQIYKRAIAYWPNNAHLWSNVGVCYRSMHILDKARDCFIRSLMVEERSETYNNMCACYVNENCPEEGLPYATKAMELQPGHAKPKWNAGLLHLELQDWNKGFELYEAGFHCGERPDRYYTKTPENDLPVWNGEKGKTVVFWDEQGLGDRILAAGLLRKVRNKCNVILECHPRLESIYRRSFPWIEHIYPTIKSDYIDWPLNHKIDCKSAVMSLARLYWKDGGFNKNPYLKPDPILVEKYKEYLKTLGPGPYIAFSWAGGAVKTNTKYRSLKLGWFKELVAEGGTWVSVQYHDWAKGKIDRFREETKLPVFHAEAAQEFNYDHTLALLAACDLTISACNTVIHTCGGAGLNCWTLVPTRRAWRYPKGDNFPWYSNTTKMYHQTKDNDWDDVLKRVKEDLRRWLCER